MEIKNYNKSFIVALLVMCFGFVGMVEYGWAQTTSDVQLEVRNASVVNLGPHNVILTYPNYVDKILDISIGGSGSQSGYNNSDGFSVSAKVTIVGLSILIPIYYSFKNKKKQEQQNEKEKIKIYLNNINQKARAKHN